MEGSWSSRDDPIDGGRPLQRGISRNHSDSTVRSSCSRGVERGDSLHSLGSQLPAPKTTRPVQRSTWNSSRNLSERSLLSTTSSILTAPILEGGDEDTMLLVEKLQNEEIMQRVLEQSVTETSGSNSFMSSLHKDIPVPIFIHDSLPAVDRRKEPPSFEFSRSVDLESEFYELDPRHSPSPPRRRNVSDEVVNTRQAHSTSVEAKMLDLRISDRWKDEDASLPSLKRSTSGRGVPPPTGSSRSLHSISSKQSLSSQQNASKPTAESGQIAHSLRAEFSRIPGTVTTTPNTSQRSLPGAVRVPTPGKVSKQPEVREAIEKFVSQPIQHHLESSPTFERVEKVRDQTENETKPFKRDCSEETVVKYKYKPKSDSCGHEEVVGLQNKTTSAGTAWKQVSASDSTYLGHGWPCLGPPKLSTAAETTSEPDFSVSGHLSSEELKQIEMALRESKSMDCKPSVTSSNEACHDQADHGLSAEDSLAIADALRQSEEEEKARREEDERRSLEMALMMQREEDERINAEVTVSRSQHQGNVRTMSREEFAAQKSGRFSGAFDGDDSDHDPDEYVSDGFRMNTTENQKWSRVNRDVVIGPDRKQRTKHDTMLNGKSNAYRLGLEEGLPSISNTAYNSFMKSTKSMTKGVASSGVGRAGRDSGGTKSGALDENVRLIVSKAINRGFIDKMNGVVNEGKEAVVYHADAGPESDGFAVAVKVFKRIQEFRARGDYVDGDPRYRTKFNDAGSREQLEIWAEKEYRNLVRANSAGIPVPFPLWTKANVVFMRFLGETRPCPQIRELDLHNGSKRWTKLYNVVLDSIRRYANSTASFTKADLNCTSKTVPRGSSCTWRPQRIQYIGGPHKLRQSRRVN